MNKEIEVVFGVAVPTEKTVEMPPKTAGRKVIKEGEIVLNLEPNTPDLIARLNRRNNQER